MTKLYISPSSQEANVGPNGYIEEKYMNLVADLLIPELLRHGFIIKRNNPKNTFKGHIEESNLWKPDYHIAMHSNASGAASSHTARGCSVYCFAPKDPSKKGTQLAQKIYNHIKTITPTADNGLQSAVGHLSEVVYTNAPAVLVEVDFHDNADGALWIMANIEAIAGAYLHGILEQCGVAYIPPAIPVYTGSTYRVQVGMFNVKANAEILLAKLKADGYNGYIIANKS